MPTTHISTPVTSPLVTITSPQILYIFNTPIITTYNKPTRFHHLYFLFFIFIKPIEASDIGSLDSGKMSPEKSELTAAGAGGGVGFDEMELTLGLPGESRERKRGTKRTFSEMIHLKLGSSEDPETDESGCESSGFEPRKLSSKEQVIGWPPVRSYRKNTMNSTCKYVKVAVDGAPYLRKVDLKSCTSYQQLLRVFEDMFSCFTIHNVLINEKKMMDDGNRSEHVPTYEDKDGDWMLVGDVPWKMFVESCTRIRLMKSSEAITQLGIYDAHLLHLK